MEDTLGDALNISHFTKFRIVLILVLMEDTLGGSSCRNI